MDQRCRQWDCIKMTVAGGTICDSLRCNSMDSQNDRLPLTAIITAVRNEYPLHCSNVACYVGSRFRWRQLPFVVTRSLVIDLLTRVVR